MAELAHSTGTPHGHLDKIPFLQQHTSDEENSGSSGPAMLNSRGEIGGTGGPVGQAPWQGVTGGRKPRGRPPGSKNKPKPPVIVTQDIGNGMRPHVLEVAAGSDLCESVAAYAKRRQRGVCVLGGSGAVANLTLRQPAAPGATVTFRGRFDILSLSGVLLPPPAPASPVGLTITVTGAAGQIVGGTVVGSLQAAGPVLVIAASFQGASFDRLPLAEDTDDSRAGNPQIAQLQDYCGAMYSVNPQMEQLFQTRA